MYAGDPGDSFNQNNTKSYIHNLLKNKEHFTDSVYCPTSKSESFESVTLQQNSLEDLALEDLNSSDLNCPENSDNQNDFNYSQKLFHIADGNLYSIFSPIQGRSYGMKPSFLSKQKYTVQECHGRGRKNLRKGLKFHNFLPSESVTSEKDNGYVKTKWKVHSECRLREEHGTKQITISNWSQNVQNSPSKSPVNYTKPATKCDSPSTRTKNNRLPKINNLIQFKNSQMANSEVINNNDPYDFNLSLQSNNLFESTNSFSKNTKESTSTISKVRDSVRSAASKKDSLSFVLNSLLDRPVSAGNGCTSSESTESSKSYQNQTHRRKPSQTRRVVPYMKYLSILEENDSVPLDLSSRDLDKKFEPVSSISQTFNPLKTQCLYTEYSNSFREATSFDLNESQRNSSPESVQNVRCNIPESNTTNVFPNSEHLSSLLQNQLSSSFMFLTPQFDGLKVHSNGPESLPPSSKNSGRFSGDMVMNNKPINIKHGFQTSNATASNPLTTPMQFQPHKSLGKESQSRTRKRNQRSVIKQKLEDTFRQNGFLVKTKQVSDGEATFCKFRQLRKYTRYYFKSWQQHLPDEVHKMWKGFLPPKTVLPPISGTSEPTTGNPPWEST